MSNCPRFCVLLSDYDPSIHKLINTYETEAECLDACKCDPEHIFLVRRAYAGLDDRTYDVNNHELPSFYGTETVFNN